jgi:16S rRNA (cytidine1402-2'-O)-methyltransferase
MSTTKGKLYLIPTRLGDNPPLEVLPISIKKMIENIDYYIVENTDFHSVKDFILSNNIVGW